MNKAFTLIELLVVMAIIGVLSGIILFSITQYINSGKDSNIAGNLSILVPAGEVYYNSYNSSYKDFCISPVVANARDQMPQGTEFHCREDDFNSYQSWAACAQKFSGNRSKAYCVDSRGVKRDIENNSCTNNITECTIN